MAKIIDTLTSHMLTIEDIHSLLQKPLRFGFPVSDGRSLILEEIKEPATAPLIIGVQPFSDQEIDRLLKEIEEEHASLKADLEQLRQSGSDPNKKTGIYERLSLLYASIRVLEQNPMASIEVYLQADGIYLAFVEHYSAIVNDSFWKRCDLPHFPADFVKLIEHIQQTARTAAEEKLKPGRVKPDPPPPGSPYDKFFDWYHHLNDDLGFKLTLEDLGGYMGLSHSRVRRLHSLYLKERGPLS